MPDPDQVLPAGTPVAGRRVVVTGATGFIGWRLCRRLADLGAEVHAVSRLDEHERQRRLQFHHDPEEAGGTHVGGPPLHWHQGDVAEPGVADRLVRDLRPATVLHLAGFVNGARRIETVLPTFHANLASAIHLLGAATASGARLVLVGSLDEPEHLDAIPASPYAASKTAATSYARMYHALFATRVVVARLFMVYGPGQPDLTKLVPYVTTSLLAGDPPRLGPGTRLADWVYVDDVVEGLVAILRHEALDGERIDLGTGTLTSVRDVVGRLHSLIAGSPPPAFGALAERPLETERVADTAPAAERLGWQAAVDLDAGLARAVEWYRRALADHRIAPPHEVSPA